LALQVFEAGSELALQKSAENRLRTHVAEHQLLAQQCCAKIRRRETFRVTSPYEERQNTTVIFFLFP